MESGTLSLVNLVDIEAQFREVDKRSRLVALGSHMQHVDVLLVLGPYVSAIFNKHFDQFHIAVEGSEVQCCEAFFSL